MPANGETAKIPTPTVIPAKVSSKLIKEEKQRYALRPPDPKRARLLHGVMMIKSDQGNELTLCDPETAYSTLKLPKHDIRFTSTVQIKTKDLLRTVQQNLYEVKVKLVKIF